MIPKGVAALPNPKRFDEIFITTADSVSGSIKAEGIIILTNGLKIFDICLTRPESSAICINPEKRQILPPIFKQYETVSNPPPKKASIKSFSLPQKTEDINENIIKTADIFRIKRLTPRYNTKSLQIKVEFTVLSLDKLSFL